MSDAHHPLTAVAVAVAISGALYVNPVWAHTISIGYENAGPGAVNFWYGTYHLPSEATYTEGSFSLVGVGSSYSITTPFTLLTSTKPSGLIDGTTNFYSNGTQLVATNNFSPVATWQGVKITGLKAGTYKFTYIPIASPTAVWQPIDSVILSSTVTLTAAVVGNTAFLPNATPDSAPAAAALDSISNSATGAMGAVIATLQGLDNSAQRAALQQLAPESGEALNQSASWAVNGVLDSVQSRLTNIQTEGYGTTAAADLASGRFMVATNGSIAGLAAGDAKPTHSFWIKALGAHEDQGMQDGFASYTAKTGGLALGADTLVASHWVVGGAFTVATTSISQGDYRAGDGATVHSYQLTGYGSRNFGRWYVQAMLAYARQKFDTDRNTGVSGVANGHFYGGEWASRVSAGWPLALAPRVTLTPVAGVEWNHLKEDGYTETGAGPLSLTVQSVSASRLRSVLGVRLASRTHWGQYAVRPSVHLFWRHQFRNDGLDSTATFTGGGGAFTTQGQSLARNTANLGGAVTVSMHRNFQLTAQLDAEHASGYTAYAGQVLGQWRF